MNYGDLRLTHRAQWPSSVLVEDGGLRMTLYGSERLNEAQWNEHGTGGEG